MRRLFNFIIFLVTIGAVTWSVDLPVAALDPDCVANVQRWRRELADERPQVVLLGNSMLGHGINIIHFAMRTGSPALKLWDGGVESAWHYLMLKNLIAPSGAKPEVLIIFFTDRHLTEPAFRVDGEYKPRLDALRYNSEPLLDDLAYGQRRRTALAYLISDNWGLDRQRAVAKPTVEDWLKKQVGRALRRGGTKQVDEAISRVFADTNLDTAVLTQAQERVLDVGSSSSRDFASLVENSFLPAEIEIARDADIRLIYVRVKRQRDARAQRDRRAPSADKPPMTQYMSELRAYLAAQRVPLLDFSAQQELEVRHFADGNHLNLEGRLIFTRMLSDAIEDYLPPRGSHQPHSELAEMVQPVVLQGPFRARPPFGWIAMAPEWEQYANRPGDTYRSVLEILEDGVPLGPASAFTREVATQGAGRFSHWRDAIDFSASDNSDPNTNGRTYSVRFRLPQ